MNSGNKNCSLVFINPKQNCQDFSTQLKNQLTNHYQHEQISVTKISSRLQNAFLVTLGNFYPQDFQCLNIYRLVKKFMKMEIWIMYIQGETLTSVQNQLKMSGIQYRKFQSSSRIDNCYNLSFDYQDRAADAYIKLSQFKLWFCDKDWRPLEELRQPGDVTRPMSLKHMSQQIWKIEKDEAFFFVKSKKENRQIQNKKIKYNFLTQDAFQNEIQYKAYCNRLVYKKKKYIQRKTQIKCSQNLNQIQNDKQEIKLCFSLRSTQSISSNIEFSEEQVKKVQKINKMKRKQTLIILKEYFSDISIVKIKQRFQANKIQTIVEYYDTSYKKSKEKFIALSIYHSQEGCHGQQKIRILLQNSLSFMKVKKNASSSTLQA